MNIDMKTDIVKIEDKPSIILFFEDELSKRIKLKSLVRGIRSRKGKRPIAFLIENPDKIVVDEKLKKWFFTEFQYIFDKKIFEKSLSENNLLPLIKAADEY